MNRKTCKKHQSSTVQMYVHRMVAEAFCAKRPDTPWVRHIDGDKSNNHADNLQWVSDEEILQNPGWVTDKNVMSK